MTPTTRRRTAFAGALLLAGVTTALGVVTASPAAHADTASTPDLPDLTALSVSGEGVAAYPAFDPSVSRYAVTTTASTGSVTVTATTTPGTQVRVDGRPAPDGVATLDHVSAGEEVSVLVDGPAGHAAYALFVTPAGFPTLARSTPDSSLASLAPGLVLLTLGYYTVPGAPYFETAVDRNGVPVWVHRAATSSLDLQQQPDGHLSVGRSTGDASGSRIVELGPDLQPIGSYRATGLTNTDNHDALLLPDGRQFFLSYEPNAATGLVDAVVTGQRADGTVFFRWSTADHGGPAQSMTDVPDYAHVNSLQLTPDGDLLLSFRHLSSVWKVALTAHDGFSPGDVEWRLGGRDSDFTFDDPTDPSYPSDGTDGGPCAQHTASMLPNGHVLVWDNGSSTATTPYCVSGTDPAGPAVPRSHTRVAEFALDQATGVAHLVWHYDQPDRFTIFAGSARRLGNGDTLLGWAADTVSVADEVAADGALLWSLRDTAAARNDRQFSYRAALAPVADWAAPTVTFDLPTAPVRQGGTATASYSCADVGGSTLQSCDSSVAEGGALDTSTPGPHTVTVTATDGAGHRTVAHGTYRVQALSAPAVVATGPVRRAACTPVVVTNAGAASDALTLRAHGADRWTTTWGLAGRDVTHQVTGTGKRLPVLAPGRSARFCLRAAPAVAGAEPRPAVLHLLVTSRRTASTARTTLRLR